MKLIKIILYHFQQERIRNKFNRILFQYEYKNDCLTVEIKFNKTFYQDNDLNRLKNLFLLTLVPLTTYEGQFMINNILKIKLLIFLFFNII